eukprot:CAMPEP_0181054920 /NCGR_PEP_ID=MMETSP1070-20121207/18935_1 /TAXON_ID=265543 /ORGANISM="Minutocellus polymorphus, Strain NH13" /LENGTH=444 /DNA_ID=CAMNT_0023134221 /DNA_START=3 /DNA_END=1337 /DNA_ORIENTATION=+
MEALTSLPSGGVGTASAMTGMFPPPSSSSCNFFALAPNQPGDVRVAGMMGLPHAQRPAPEFLYHLTRMLREPSNHHLIEWDAGRILVHDPIRLESEVLGKYYRHSKYSSFQRQLNYFGFKKISGKRKMSPCSYTNDNVTESLDSLIQLRRKPVKKHRPAHPSEGGEQKGPTGKMQGTGNGRTTSKPSVQPIPSSLAHQASYTSSTTPTSDVNSSNSDSEHGHQIDLDSFRSGLCSGGLNGLFSESFKPQTTTTNNSNTGVLPAISSAIAVTEYCTQPLLVSAEEFKAPGDCAPLRGVLPAPAIPLPFPSSHHRHQPVVTPLPSSLGGSGSSSSDNSTASSSTAGDRSAINLPVPNIFSVQHLLQRQQQTASSSSATLHYHPGAPSQVQQQQQCRQDAADDIATFLALESAFGAGFDERSYGASEDNLSEGSTSASGDSWLPDPL